MNANNDGTNSTSEGGASTMTTKVIQGIMSTLPHFPDLLKSRASHFLAAHLPLIRAKVKSVLVIIAGTTASKLGQIRQTLYDKTDGVECMMALDDSGVCTWDEVVGGMVDIQVMSHGTTFATKTTTLDSGEQGSGGGSMNGQSHAPRGTTTTTTTTVTTSVGTKSSGAITITELSSSFDLTADDNDGLISFDEAMEVMESSFSGTHFHVTEMVRDTLILSHSSAGEPSSSREGGFRPNAGALWNVTLSELALLSAWDLWHDDVGRESALGTVQSLLDNIVHQCFQEWTRAALSPPPRSFTTILKERIVVASTVSDNEWKQLNGLIEKEDDVLLKEISGLKGDKSRLLRRGQSTTVVGEVSPHGVFSLIIIYKSITITKGTI